MRRVWQDEDPRAIVPTRPLTDRVPAAHASLVANGGQRNGAGGATPPKADDEPSPPLTAGQRAAAWLTILGGLLAIPGSVLLGAALDSERAFSSLLIFGIAAIVGGIYSLARRVSMRAILATPVRGRRRKR